MLPVALAGNTKLWRGKTLRLCIAAPLSALAAGASHVAEQAFVDRKRTVLQAAAPAPPPEPADETERWRRLTHVG